MYMYACMYECYCVYVLCPWGLNMLCWPVGAEGSADISSAVSQHLSQWICCHVSCFDVCTIHTCMYITFGPAGLLDYNLVLLCLIITQVWKVMNLILVNSIAFNNITYYLHTCNSPETFPNWLSLDLHMSSWPIVLCCRLNRTFHGHAPWTIDLHTYSIEDFVEIKTGTKMKYLRSMLGDGIQHVKTCPLCMGKGFICELCDNTKDIIFPFEHGKVSICKGTCACDLIISNSTLT